jgi:polyisoprenoid-binding protein YceI
MTHRSHPTSLIWIAVVAGCYLAAPARAQAPYQVDTNVSRVYIRVDTATRVGHAHGVVGKLLGSVVTLGGKGEMVFDMPSFVTDTPEARQYVGLDGKFSDPQKVTSNMLGEGVLNVAQYPRATFAIASITPLDGQAAGLPGRYQVTGQFTLHGVTQPLQFAAQVEQTDKPGVFRMKGQFSILQTRFGITPYSAVGGLVRVADELKVWGDLVLTPGK